MSTTFVATAQAWLSSKEAAAYLRVSESRLRHDRCEGHWGLRFYRLGGRVLYRREDLDRFVLSQAQTPAPPQAVQASGLDIKRGRSTKLEQHRAKKLGITVAELRRRDAGGKR